MKFFLTVLLLLLFANVLYLDWHFIITPQTEGKKVLEHPIPTDIPEKTNACSSSCVTLIQQATSSAQRDSSASPVAVRTETVTSGVKEYFVSFGSGSVANREWTDVPGLQSYVDTGNYPGMTKALFEISLHVPTANETVNARLYNVTANHPVWGSDVFFAGGSDAPLLISGPVTLDSGSNLYQVQLQTQLEYPAIVDQSRLHIFLN